jgi:hypothetical protein
MPIRWDEFPHARLRLQIHARLACNDVARSDEDSLRRILIRRLPKRDADDHRRYIEIEARSLVEHLRCTRDVYGSFVDCQNCRPRLEAQWVVLRFAVFPTAVSILRHRVIEYSHLTTVLARDLSLLFGIATRPCCRNVAKDITLICFPDLDDQTKANDTEIESLSRLIDEDSLLIFKDIREDGGAVIRLFGGGPFSLDDRRSILNSFGMGAIQAGITLPEWIKSRERLWHLSTPWTDGLCDMFISVQEELFAQWRALPSDCLVRDLEVDERTSRFSRVVVPTRSTVLSDTLPASNRSASESEPKSLGSSNNREKLKPGRKPRIREEFVLYAGRLWQKAISCEGGTVTIGRLREIAVALDQAGYLPPAAYLEGKIAEEIKLFNSRNSNSKNGPVKTWFELISRGDKDHVRGMRRLLSRCSRRLSRRCLSGN